MHYLAILILSLATVLTAVLSAEDPARVAYSSRPFSTSEPVPALYEGYLFYHDGPNSLTLYNTHDGKLVYTTSLKNLKIGGNTRITSAALTPEGITAVGVAYLLGNDGYTGGLAFLDRTGAQIRFAGTGAFMPCHVTYDSKGSLWAFGTNVAPDNPDYAVARRFDNQGKQTGAFLMRSTFPSDPFHCHRGLWTARASKDRVGAMAQFFNMAEPQHSRGTLQQWVELDLDGKEIGRWTLGAERDGPGDQMAFTEDGRLFVKRREQLSELDRKNATWKPAALQHRALLLGAEGNQLVYAEGNGMRFVWIQP